MNWRAETRNANRHFTGSLNSLKTLFVRGNNACQVCFSISVMFKALRALMKINRRMTFISWQVVVSYRLKPSHLIGATSFHRQHIAFTDEAIVNRKKNFKFISKSLISFLLSRKQTGVKFKGRKCFLIKEKTFSHPHLSLLFVRLFN